LVATGALGAVMLLASSQTSYAADSSPTPGMSSDMPGMDMGSGSAAPTPTPAATEAPIPGPDAGEMPGMDMSGSTGHQHGGSTGPAASRPLAPVLGTFGGGTVAVMLTAGMMRRKDREVLVAKKAMRAGRSGK
jgi:hypothetical protein